MEVAVHLLRDAERVSDVETLAHVVGGRVGLDGVLADLNRSAHPSPVPGSAVSWGFALDAPDSVSSRWWPQGITTSADASDDATYAGRKVVVTSSYAKEVRRTIKGARLTFFDVTDRKHVRYRHVLLVEAVVRHGRVDCRPVVIHAGGIVWHGGYIHVAGTEQGLYTFRVDDIVRIDPGTSPNKLGRMRDGRLAGYGHRYLLPVRFKYAAVTTEGHEAIRYSFMSLDRSGEEHRIIAGEYGRGGQTTRLVRYAVDPRTGLFLSDGAGASRPLDLRLGGIQQMQGAVAVDDAFYVTQSRGRLTRGCLWVGRPGEFERHPDALPPGPEDICYWPSSGELWSVSEHPSTRYVFAMQRSYFD